MTPAEAKDLWCPFARSYDRITVNDEEEERPVTLNRTWSGSPSGNCRCLASGCMAWRWSPIIRGEGYCGLAGHLDHTMGGSE